MTQRETLWLAEPMNKLLEHKGWVVTNLTSGKYMLESGQQAFQKTLPDCFATHKDYGMRWIEYKIFDSAWKIHLTKAQRNRFPKLIFNGMKIWCLATNKSIVGLSQKGDRFRLYNKLFEEPNGEYMLNKAFHFMLK